MWQVGQALVDPTLLASLSHIPLFSLCLFHLNSEGSYSLLLYNHQCTHDQLLTDLSPPTNTLPFLVRFVSSRPSWLLGTDSTGRPVFCFKSSNLPRDPKIDWTKLLYVTMSVFPHRTAGLCYPIRDITDNLHAVICSREYAAVFIIC